MGAAVREGSGEDTIGTGLMEKDIDDQTMPLDESGEVGEAAAEGAPGKGAGAG